MICPKCNGRGSVFNTMSLLLTVGLPIALLMDANNKDGLTREKCPLCDGEKFIYEKENPRNHS